MSVNILESRAISMVVENVKLIDSTGDASPKVIGMEDAFQLSVDVSFKPITEPLTQCLMEQGHLITAFFGVESIGTGKETQLIKEIETHTKLFKYTIQTDAVTPKQEGLLGNAVYMFSVGVAFSCPETPKSLLVGFEDGHKFFIYKDREIQL